LRLCKIHRVAKLDECVARHDAFLIAILLKMILTPGITRAADEIRTLATDSSMYPV
jgi:hypothetical protein